VRLLVTHQLALGPDHGERLADPDHRVLRVLLLHGPLLSPSRLDPGRPVGCRECSPEATRKLDESRAACRGSWTTSSKPFAPSARWRGRTPAARLRPPWNPEPRSHDSSALRAP